MANPDKTTTTVPALYAAAAWNISGSLSAMLAPQLHYRLFDAIPAPDSPMLRVYHNTLWSFVLVMGICYAVAAYEPLARKGVLLAGAIGKPVACLIWAIAFMQGIGSPMPLIGGLGDLLWAVYFVTLLRRMPTLAAAT
ncbi:MAG: hypothetical protein H7338_04730 [Candidatus Sericytochromatia bacterium]|nr:hypothetical protein [Candidatus Sericytochromatia bacterium]